MRILPILLILGACLNTRADDWPQLLGGQRDGIYKGALLKEWPANGPSRLWKRPVGEGFAGPAVKDGRIILFHREDHREVIEAIDLKSGETAWKQAYGTGYSDMFGFDNGPRAVPAIHGGTVFTLGAEGTVCATRFSDGKLLWKRDLAKDYDVPTGFFGLVCSPLVDETGVYLNVGGSNGAGILCLDPKEGHERWRATRQEASYSSPTFGSLGGSRKVLFLAREGLVVLAPSNGKVDQEFTWKARIRESVNAATPIVHNDQIFITASYNTGANLLQYGDGNLKSIWSGDDQLSSQYATPILKEGHLYGLHGRHDYNPGPVVRCVEWKSGKVLWSSLPIKPANIMMADGQLLILCETGQLIRARASISKFEETGRAQILGTTVRAYPALADGIFVARDKQQMVAIDLSPAD